MIRELPKILINVKEEMKQMEKAKRDAKDYMDSIPDSFNAGYKKRRDLYKGYARCENLTRLYDECKQCEPVYIPHKFREDRFFVRDEEELAIVNVRFMGKFDSEYNLLKKRQRDFAAAINAKDDIIYALIEQCDTTDIVKAEIAAIWEKDVKGDEEKINEEWKKKVTGMKAAYEKDKQKLEELNQKRRAKFEQLQRNTRRVEVNEERNRMVISLSSFDVNGDEQFGEEISSTIQPSAEDTGLVEDTVSFQVSSERPPNAQELSDNVIVPSTHDPRSPTLTIRETNNVAEETVQNGDETLPQSTEHLDQQNITIRDNSAEISLNSSAPLFETTVNNGDDVFATQDRNNILHMAGNFATPEGVTSSIISNYKFRKRQPLK